MAIRRLKIVGGYVDVDDLSQEFVQNGTFENSDTWHNPTTRASWAVAGNAANTPVANCAYVADLIGPLTPGATYTLKVDIPSNLSNGLFYVTMATAGGAITQSVPVPFHVGSHSVDFIASAAFTIVSIFGSEAGIVIDNLSITSA